MTLTPEQFNKIAMKEDLKNLATKDDINRVLTAVDSMVTKQTKFDQELTSNQAAHDRFDKRINKLETASV